MAAHRYLVLQYRTWIVRIIIPPAVRHLFPDADGKAKRVIKRSTGESDICRAQTVAAPIIAGIQRQIVQAKLTLRPPLQDRADALVADYLKASGATADRLVMRDLTMAVLQQQGMSIATYEQGRLAGVPVPDVEKTVQLMIVKLTPFDTHLKDWAKTVTVAPKTRDEYLSGIREFLRMVDEPLETLTRSKVQRAVDEWLSDEDGEALDAKTVNKKLSGLHNYWMWCADRNSTLDPESRRQPFPMLKVKNAYGTKKVLPERYEVAGDDVDN